MVSHSYGLVNDMTYSFTFMTTDLIFQMIASISEICLTLLLFSLKVVYRISV